MNHDLINACFEIGGTLVTALNLRAIWRDRVVKGVSIAPTMFFLAWGFWNLLFYSGLHQGISFASAFGLIVVNLLWLVSVGWLRS